MSEEQNPQGVSLDNLELESAFNSSESVPVESESIVPDGSADDSRTEIPTANSAELQLLPEQIIAVLEQEIETLTQQLEEQTQQGEAYKKRCITLAAEFDNFRKRTSKEKEELETTIKGKTLTELLAVVDNFERARTQIKPANEGETAIHKSYQGVYKTLVDSLKRLGVSPMRPEGQLFDPNEHEAMMREYTDEYPEGTVIEQLVRGYVLGDRVLRHALVKVAASKESDPNAPSESSESPVTAPSDP